MDPFQDFVVICLLILVVKAMWGFVTLTRIRRDQAVTFTHRKVREASLEDHDMTQGMGHDD